MDTLTILQRFADVRANGPGDWFARCPAHNDTNASLHISDKNGRLLLKCFAGCAHADILSAVGLTWKDLPQNERQPDASSEPFYGLTIARYSEAKRIPVAALNEYHVTEGMRSTKNGRWYPGLKIPYLGPNGEPGKVRWRMRLQKEQGTEPSRFLWEKEGAMSLYGLWRQPERRESILLVEGESDCHSLWLNGYDALGLPGASNYKPDRDDAILEQYSRVYIHIEKDTGGKAVFGRFAGDQKHRPSKLLPRLLFFSLPGYKDPSDAWCQLHDRPQEFQALISAALRAAVPAQQFRHPDAWGDAAPELPPQDGRARTSPENGMRGGRPQADIIGLAADYASYWRNQDGEPLLRFWRNAWYQYNGLCYAILPDADLENNAMRYLLNPDVEERFHVKPSVGCLRNLLAAIRSQEHFGIPVDTPMGSWLGEQPAEPTKRNEYWMAMPASPDGSIPGCLLDIAGAADYLYSGNADAPFRRTITPMFLSTFSMGYHYDPAAACPNFDAWLLSTLPDEEVRDTFLSMMGLCLVPDTSFEVAFFLYGQAGCGKTTALKVLEALVGRQNVCRVPLLSFDDKFAVWPLAENLVNIVGEMATDDPQGRIRYLEGDFKDSVSGGDIHVEHKGKDPTSAPCTARHVFATNELPKFFDKSEGIWDRLVIIPFEQRFRGSDKCVRNIIDTMLPELPGIFNRALAALGRLRAAPQDQRFPEAQRCRDAKQLYRSTCDPEQDYFRLFYRPLSVEVVREDGTRTVVPDPNARLDVETAFEHYDKWLQHWKYMSRSRSRFFDSVRRFLDRERVVLPDQAGGVPREFFLGLQPLWLTSTQQQETSF